MVGVFPHSDFIIGRRDFQFKIQMGKLKKKINRNSSVKFLNNNCFFFQFVECFPSLNVPSSFHPQHFVSVWVPEYLN
jgi:hypothetical protein